MTKRHVLMVLVVCSLTFSWHASVVYNYMGSLDTSLSCFSHAANVPEVNTFLCNFYFHQASTNNVMSYCPILYYFFVCLYSCYKHMNINKLLTQR